MGEAVLKTKIMFPHYAHLEARLKSFKIPTHLNGKSSCSVVFDFKEELSDAGFFYTGKNDETICYYCGGGLKDWGVDDDPWEEHARWFGSCPYLLMKKGQYFAAQHRDGKTCNPDDIISKPVDEAGTSTGKECIICLKNERNMLFLPCNHCCTCNSCGLKIDNCVYCRAPITSFMKIFLV